MCLGSIHALEDVWEDQGARVGRLTDGTVVSLGFVPEAGAGDYVIVHLGIPVEVLPTEDAFPATNLRAGANR